MSSKKLSHGNHYHNHTKENKMRVVKSTSVKDEEIFKKQFVKTADGRYVEVLVSCNISDEAMISFNRKPYDC